MTTPHLISLSAVITLFASPALAHHEVVVATSLMPVALPFIATCVAGLAVWRKRRNSQKKR